MERLLSGHTYRITSPKGQEPIAALFDSAKIGNNQQRHSLVFAVSLKKGWQVVNGKQVEFRHPPVETRRFLIDDVGRADGSGYTFHFKGYDISSAPWVQVQGIFEAEDQSFMDRSWGYFTVLVLKKCGVCTRVDYRVKDEVLFCDLCGTRLTRLG